MLGVTIQLISLRGLSLLVSLGAGERGAEELTALTWFQLRIKQLLMLYGGIESHIIKISF